MFWNQIIPAIITIFIHTRTHGKCWGITLSRHHVAFVLFSRNFFLFYGEFYWFTWLKQQYPGMVDAPYSCHVLDINVFPLFWMGLSFRSDLSEIAFLISLTRRILFGERSEFLNKYHENFHVLFVCKKCCVFWNFFFIFTSLADKNFSFESCPFFIWHFRTHLCII